MPFSRPTLSDLRSRVASLISAALPGTDALLRYANLTIMGKAQASLAHGHYGYLDWIAQQAVPFTAQDEYLEGWAALKRVIRKQPTAAIGTATFPGTDDTPLPSGTPVFRNDGTAYVTTQDATVSGESVTAPIAATTLGAIGNADAGTAMTLGQGIAGIGASGTSSLLTGGADLEVDDDLRTRMLQAYSSPARGGSIADYIEWALDVPGVTRAWIVPGGMGAGTVLIYFMMDDAESAHGGFPQGTDGAATAETRAPTATGDQLLLANAVQTEKPAHVIVWAVAPTQNIVDFTIAGLSTAPTPVQTAIEAAIDEALLRNAVPGGVTEVSAIEQAISNVSGSAGFVITTITCSAGTVGPGSAGNITSDAGALPVRGAVTFA